MHISNVNILNYKNFNNNSINLFPFTILIGENDTGKSNFIKAINLVLFNKSQNYYSKVLFPEDINDQAVDNFYDNLNKPENLNSDFSYANIPRVEITVTFENFVSLGDETIAIVRNWIVFDDELKKDVARIKYVFYPLLSKKEEIFNFCKESLNKHKKLIPTEYYEYKIISLSDGKKIDYDELQRVVSMTIDAERDEQSISLVNSRKNSVLPHMLKTNLDDVDKVKLINIYNEMVDEIKEIEGIKNLKDSFNTSFEEVLESDNKLTFLPNSDNFQDLLYSLKLGYNNSRIESKGLGTKNLVLISLLLSKYVEEKGVFNIISIEEPEAHLSNSLLLRLVSYLEKVQEEEELNKKRQVLITSHSSYVINKLNIKNVVVFSKERIFDLSSLSDDTSDFFKKLPNYELLNALYLQNLILVEGPSEEIFLNSIFEKYGLKRKVTVLSINGIAFKRYLEVWNERKKTSENNHEKILLITDSDGSEKRVQEYESLEDISKNIYVSITEKNNRTFELELIEYNKKTLEKLYNKSGDKLKEHMTNSNNKTKCALMLSQEILKSDKNHIVIPPYIKNKLKIFFPSVFNE